jgi:hypothetical protein
LGITESTAIDLLGLFVRLAMTTSPFILNLRELPQFFKSEPLDVNTECRPHFPGLEKGYLFADNAGGSQVRCHCHFDTQSLIICRPSDKCLKEVVDKISDYLLNTNVQLGTASVDSARTGF